MTMTAPAKPLRARLLAAVHAKLKAKSMPDDVYRDFLWDNFETASAAALTDAGLRELLHRLDHWRRERAFYRDSRYIWVLWEQYLCPLLRPRERTDKYLTGIANAAAGTSLTAPDFDALEPGERHKIIEALKLRIKQQGGDHVIAR